MLKFVGTLVHDSWEQLIRIQASFSKKKLAVLYLIFALKTDVNNRLSF